jgi:tetratricopeptide (TPR) repeat protein
MVSLRAPQGLLCVFFFGLITGCGSPANEDLVRNAQVTFDDAVAKEASGDLAATLPLIDSALSNGGLNPDQLAEAYLLRARCYCASGELEKAQLDIDMADQGAPNPAKLHLTRGILLDKQGKSAEAKVEFSKAKKADPAIALP